MVKTTINHIKNRCSLIIMCLSFVLTTACDQDEKMLDESQEYTYVSIIAGTARSGINQDTQYWEDRVDELRMIVFDAETGAVAFNEMLYFPDGFTGKSKAVRLRPGQYDFCFIANGTTYTGEFTSALMNITRKSDFQTDPRFTHIAYTPDFVPDENSSSGRFLLSAMYEKIEVIPGGVENAPWLQSWPTGKVELVRALAKVEVIFRKKVQGSVIPEEAINAVSLKNVASLISVPPYDDYYEGPTDSTNSADLSGLNLKNDSIGVVTFYVPEFLVPPTGTLYPELVINNQSFPIQTDEAGITAQRRTVPDLSPHSVIRNTHYVINAYVNSGNTNEIEIRVYVKPWQKEKHTYIFEDDKHIVLPPILPTDTSVVMPTLCGDYIEILYRNEALNLQDAYNYAVNWGSQTVTQGGSPYYCEKKYGPEWRMIGSCELMSYLAALDIANNVWLSNTWDMDTYNGAHPEASIPLYPLAMRKAAQRFLESLTGTSLSDTQFIDETTAQPWEKDQVSNNKAMGLIGNYFIPGDILYKPDQFESGWTGEIQENWFYYEVAFQIPAVWWTGGTYITLADRNNWDIVLYTHFRRFDFTGLSRCVRSAQKTY